MFDQFHLPPYQPRVVPGHKVIAYDHHTGGFTQGIFAVANDLYMALLAQGEKAGRGV